MQPTMIVIISLILLSLFVLSLTVNDLFRILGAPLVTDAAGLLPGFFLAAVLFLLPLSGCISLPVFFLLSYILVACVLFPHHGDNRRETFFVANLCFLVFTMTHLVVIGALSLFFRIDIHGILNSTGAWEICILVTLLLIIALGQSLRHTFQKAALAAPRREEEFRLLSGTTWFWVAFVMMDSVPSMFPLPTTLASLFLVGSNLLALGILLFFILHVHRISQNAYLEEEHDRLVEEEAVQRSRITLIEKTAYTDPLTGAFVQTYVDNCMDAMLEAAEPFSLAYMDLDSLKRINDTGGHAAGDAYLIRFTRELGLKLRSNDILARIGGDEFLVVMPNLPLEDAKRRLSAIREELEQGPSPIFFSMGIVYAPARTDRTALDYRKDADHRMYEDKKSRH